MNFNALKNKSSFDKLTKALDVLSKGQGASSADSRFWQPDVDKAGNGFAVIRFLDAPAVDGEDGMPWVQLFNHGFQGPGGWYIENCPTTMQGHKCPVCEKNTELWNSGIEANKDIVRQRKRKLSYISNIMVVKDAAHPENEGKVFLYKFGKKIFDKIKEKLEPQFEDEEAINPFNFWKGANFKLKIRNVEGYRNYDKSEFDNPSPIDLDDEVIEKIWKDSYSLKDFVKASEFKSYDELLQKRDRVLGAAPAPRTKNAESMELEEEVNTQSGSEDDEALSYFNKLAGE